MNIYLPTVPAGHIAVKFGITSSTTLDEAARGIAIGQSIGNPGARVERWETSHLIDTHCAKIIGSREDLLSRHEGDVVIAFPLININWREDGLSQLLCTIMGGQCDIDIIERCWVVDIDLDLVPRLTPRYGLSGLRELTGRYDRPLLGCIIKPKIGLSAGDYGTIVEEMVRGGADIIKEDEILANPVFCSMEERLSIVREIIGTRKIVYLATINADADRLLDKARMVARSGIRGVHLNVWSGLGSYGAVRRLGLDIALHYQKSGDRAWSDRNNKYRITWWVLCKLAAWSGVDTIHAGMWGGYLSDDPVELAEIMRMLTGYNVVPALSCGMNAELIPKVTDRFGVDYMANVGAACHSHPLGVEAGVRELRRAIDGS
jgi:ribulose-bisphosphate carboxylase large chain